MLINLFINSSQNNVVDKNLALLADEINAQPYSTVTILSPILIIDYNDTYVNCNYIYIKDFNRYYYCTVSVTTGQTMILTCYVDVLTSFKVELLKARCLILRTVKANFTLIPDTQYPLSDKQFLNEYIFPEQPFKLQDAPGQTADQRCIIMEVR